MDNLMDKENHFVHEVAHRFTHSTRFCPQAPQGQSYNKFVYLRQKIESSIRWFSFFANQVLLDA